MKPMVTSSTARYTPSADATFTYANIRPIQKLSSRLILRKVENRADVTYEDVSKAIKCAGSALEYPTKKGIPIARLDTHSLRSGGPNAPSLAGYSDTQIQNMG